MTAERHVDALIRAFFDTPEPELPDRVFDAVRGEIHRTRQQGTWGSLPAFLREGWIRVALAMAAAVVLGMTALLAAPRGAIGPGGGPAPTASASPQPTPTAFMSTLYGYRIVVPVGWVVAPALVPWDGVRQPGPDGDVDKFAGPDKVGVFGFAGPFDGTITALVSNRVAANARDHGDTCPHRQPELMDEFRSTTERWVILAWNCGAVIQQALAVRDGIAYAFTFRDLGTDAASTPVDRALFESILESVHLPG